MTSGAQFATSNSIHDQEVFVRLAGSNSNWKPGHQEILMALDCPGKHDAFGFLVDA